MKNLRTTVLCAGFALCSLGSFAQNKTIPVNEPDYNKPKLFANMPDKIPVSADELNALFITQVGRPANLNAASDVQAKFEGEVISVSDQSVQGLQSILIRSTNFNGARMSFSKITQEDGTVKYTGRIISFKHGDLYELQNQQGQLVLVKRNFYDLINE